MNITKHNFSKNGFFKGKFNNKTFNFLKKFVFELELSLKKKTKYKNIKFNNFHNYDFSIQNIIALQEKLRNISSKSKNFTSFARTFAKDIEFLLGPDISYQTSPWFRIARPMKFEDNIGFHKDTMYGQDPLIPTLFCPLVNLNTDGNMIFVRKSHNLNEKKLSLKKESFIKSQKNSKLHKLGIPFNPKCISVKKEKKFKIKFGEYVLFSPAIIHGQEINKSKITRFSFDLRFINTIYQNSFPNKRFKFKSICSSDLVKIREDYIRANRR